MNNVTVLGYIANEPQQKNTKNGKPFLSFTIADNVNKESVIWWQITVFDMKPHDRIIPHLKKGMPIIVQGSLTSAKPYQMKNGDMGVGMYVIPNSIRFNPFGGKKDEEGQQSTQPTSQPQQQYQQPQAPQQQYQQKPAEYVQNDLPF